MSSPSLPSSLEAALIPALPSSAYYIPNFITADEESQLLQHINTAPLPTWRNLSHRRLQAHPSPLTPSNTLLASSLPTWLHNPIIPRLLSLPLSPSSSKSSQTDKTNLFSTSPHGQPNHCLINEYKPGQGIHAHEDGDAYFPVVCTVSLGSHIVLDVRKKKKQDEEWTDEEGGSGVGGEVAEPAERWRILQERRSLLVTTGELYTECLHGIESLMVDEELNEKGIANWKLLGEEEAFREGRKERETRVSLTFRDVIQVKNVAKALGGLFNKGRR